MLAKQPFVRRCTTSRCAAASRADYANPRRARQQWNDELGRHCSSVNASRLRVASEWQRRLRMVARSRIQTPRPDECAPSRVEMRDLSNAAGGIKDTRHASPMKLTTIRAVPRASTALLAGAPSTHADRLSGIHCNLPYQVRGNCIVAPPHVFVLHYNPAFFAALCLRCDLQRWRSVTRY